MISLIVSSNHPPIATFPAEQTIATIIKNITDTHITHEVINIKEFPAELIQFTSLLSAIGSIKAETVLYKNALMSIFMVGNKTITINIINPMLPSAFFNNIEYPATVEIASDKHLPTIGTKLSTANLAVFATTLSKVSEVIPLTVIIPINIVISIPCPQSTILFRSDVSLSILKSSLILFTNCNTNVADIIGINILENNLPAIFIVSTITGSIVVACTVPPIVNNNIKSTGNNISIKFVIFRIVSLAKSTPI